MVSRLVEKQDVRVFEGELSEDDSISKSVGELSNGGSLMGTRDTESTDLLSPELHDTSVDVVAMEREENELECPFRGI